MTCHLQAARMTCQNHVLLENAFELRSTRPEERLTMREMEFRDKTALQQCRDCRVEIIQMWIRKHAAMCANCVFFVSLETSISDVDCLR